MNNYEYLKKKSQEYGGKLSLDQIEKELGFLNIIIPKK